MKPDFTALHAGLDDLAAQDASPETVAAELIRMGAALSVVTSGPAATMEGLLGLTKQLADTFPAEFQAVSVSAKFPPVQGNG